MDSHVFWEWSHMCNRLLYLLPCGLGTRLEEGLTPPASHTCIMHHGKECAGVFLTYKLPSLSRVQLTWGIDAMNYGLLHVS